MSSYVRRGTLLRRPTQVAGPGEMVDLRMEHGSWREGFFGAPCASPTTETGEVLIWVCAEEEYEEARWEERRAVGTGWPAKRMRVSPSPTPSACLTGTGERGVERGSIRRGASHRLSPGYRALPCPTHTSVLGSNLFPWGCSRRRGEMRRRA